MNPERNGLDEQKNPLHELEAAFNYCFAGISIVNKHGKIIRSNPAMQKLLQLPAEAYVGKCVSELVRDGIFNVSVSDMVLSTGNPVNMLQEISSGAKFLTVGVPVIGNGGEVELVVISSHDVTELYSLKERLRQSQKLAAGFQIQLTDMRWAQMQQQDIVVRSKKMLSLLDLAKRLANVDTTVLILGESGTGKEVVAGLLHRANPHRADKAFITVNCGAIPRDLLEAELFGYEHGAFTGAAREGKAGLFELADGGSIFLDEIGEMPSDLQVKLLRVLQEREFTRIGASKVKKIDIRVIAASNKDLKALVEQGGFRKDLYYRLNVVPLLVPPLRERKEDILALAKHYVQHFNRKYGFEKILSTELIDLMENYPWPGNVRELVNVVERMVVTSRDTILSAADFPVDMASQTAYSNSWIGTNGMVGSASASVTAFQTVDDYPGLEQLLAETERLAVINALKNSKTTALAARRLGISRATLNRKMSKHSISRHS